MSHVVFEAFAQLFLAASETLFVQPEKNTKQMKILPKISFILKSKFLQYTSKHWFSDAAFTPLTSLGLSPLGS